MVVIIFWLVVLVWIGLIAEAVIRWEESWAKPALALYGTIGAWYPGNFIYAGADHFKSLFSDNVVNTALIQVIGFLIFLRICIPWVTKWLAPRSTQTGSANVASFDQQMVPLFWCVFTLWVVLFSVAMVRLEKDILSVLWPPLSREKVSLYVHSGIGGGAGFLIATAQYSYQMTCAFFGVAFILGRGWLRLLSFIMVCITWPYFLFDHARNVQLSITMPMLISYLLLGRAHVWIKALLTFLTFAFLYVWFILVADYRSDYDVSKFLQAPRYSKASLLQGRHFGLDMLEELCYIDSFIQKGTYKINHGERYLADALNFVPRAIWRNKPLLGQDYALARGVVNPNLRYREEGLGMVIATGMIGQGVVNFGRTFGVMAAAFLASLWVGLLARLWTERLKLGKAFLFILGLGLTFNLGREITLLVLWPFVFATVGVWFVHKFVKQPDPLTSVHKPQRLPRRR